MKKQLNNNNSEMCQNECQYCPMSNEGKELYGCKQEGMIGRLTNSKKE